MAIRKVAAFQTSDGKSFPNIKEAREHERTVAAQTAIKKFARSVMFHGMDADDLAEALEERGHEIKIDAYNLLYDLPRPAVGTPYIVHCSSAAGNINFRFVATDPDNEEARDRLIDEYIESIRAGGIPDVTLEAVIPEETGSLTTVVGISALE